MQPNPDPRGARNEGCLVLVKLGGCAPESILDGASTAVPRIDLRDECGMEIALGCLSP